MNSRITLLAPVAAVILALGGCSSMSERDKSTAVGAGVGAVGDVVEGVGDLVESVLDVVGSFDELADVSHDGDRIFLAHCQPFSMASMYAFFTD